MSAGINKLIELVQKTNDRLVVLDAEGEPSFVIVPFDQYRVLRLSDKSNMPDLSQEQLLEKINQDIALWKSSVSSVVVDEALDSQPFKTVPLTSHGLVEPIQDVPEAEKVGFSLNKDKKEATDEQYYFEPIE